MKRSFLFVCIVAVVFPVVAQDFKGHVMDRKQRPLKGLKVWRKNTTESVVTDKLGIFMFAGIQPKDTLVIAVSKKEEVIIPVKELREVSVKLEKKYFLVHDGAREVKSEYRRLPRASFNSNVLTQEQIQRLSASNFYDLFKGTIPGVNVNNGSSGRVISLRGSNSLELDTEPLFVVNGTQYERSQDVDQSISVSDIEKIEVLKEGSGYGIKGANGVVIITLKKR